MDIFFALLLTVFIGLAAISMAGVLPLRSPARIPMPRGKDLERISDKMNWLDN